MATRTQKSRSRGARLQLGLSQAEAGDRLGVTGAAMGHYASGLSKPSPDRAARLAKLLGPKPNEIDASERDATTRSADRPRPGGPRPGAARRGAGDAKAPSREEGAVLDARRAMPAAERRVMVRLVPAYRRAGSRTALGSHR